MPRCVCVSNSVFHSMRTCCYFRHTGRKASSGQDSSFAAVFTDTPSNDQVPCPTRASEFRLPEALLITKYLGCSLAVVATLRKKRDFHLNANKAVLSLTLGFNFLFNNLNMSVFLTLWCLATAEQSLSSSGRYFFSRL